VSGPLTQRSRNLVVVILAVSAVATAVCLLRTEMQGQSEPGRGGFSPLIELARPTPTRQSGAETLGRADISADMSQEWTDGEISILMLRGRCVVRHESTRLSADAMVIWRKTESNVFRTKDRMMVYLEGNARIEQPGSTTRDTFLLWDLTATNGVTMSVRRRLTGRPGGDDPLFRRADKRRSDSLSTGRGLQPTQLIVPDSPEDIGPQLLALQPQQRRGGFRRVRIFPRSEVSFTVRSFESKATAPPEQVWVLTGGINMIIDGDSPFGLIDLSADRMVVWTRPMENGEFQTETVQSQDTPFEVYLEGNIVVRQGRNVIRAARAAYDARENRGLILDAELRAFVPALKDTVRVRAERIRQLSRSSFHAQNAWTTTSKFGFPGYRIQASDIFLENRSVQPLFGPPEIDPETGGPSAIRWLTSTNNTFFLERVPVFYLPYLSAPAEDPNIPLRRLTLGNDRILGFKAQSVWNMFGLLGMEEPKGVEWDLLADYFSNRGPALGTAGRYQGADLFGLPGPYSGEGLIYGIQDDGKDNLGLRRRALEPEDRHRFRVQWRHRQDIPDGMTLIGELGLLSDRNFLEQYYEREFDKEKDVETLIYGKKQDDNKALTLLARPQLNDFETTTEWLPRGDLYVLSEPFFNGRLTWSTHTSAGYGRLRVGEAPDDPADTFVPLPFVTNAEGAVLMSRHELNAPFRLGPVNVVPYVMGEAAFWSEGFDNDDLSRLVGTAGVRSSVMFWRVFPNVASELLNLNGLAHKSLVEVDYGLTDSSRGIGDIPQFNEFDENSQERFRSRLITNTYRGVLPPTFEPRNYAIRNGAGQYVTVPYHELVDDLQVARLAWRHQLQTKVGPPERLRIKDWMTLDLEASFFPQADRDNFGEDFGLLGAFYRWNIGSQTTLLANAQYDLFDDAQQIWNLGYILGRRSRGSLYLGLRQLKGRNLDSQIFTAAISYKMSPKWVTTLSTAYDVGEARNAGQSLTLTRIGADFLVHVGAQFDASKDNAGISVSVEPRLGAFKSRLTRLGSLVQGPR